MCRRGIPADELGVAADRCGLVEHLHGLAGAIEVHVLLLRIDQPGHAVGRILARPGGDQAAGDLQTVKMGLGQRPARVQVLHRHVPVPEHPPPDQPVKTEPADGVAVSVTCVPSAKLAEQVAPQSIPAGPLETEPDPAPDFVTDNEWVPPPWLWSSQKPRP